MSTRIRILATVCLTIIAAGCAASEGPDSAVAADGAAAPPPPAAPANGAGAILTGAVSPASAGFPSVVILESGAPSDPAAPPLPEDPVVMDQIGLDFSPDVLVIRTGRIVRFHNSEDVLHNIHVIDSRSGESVANVATPAPGSTYDLAFEKAGEYAIRCDVHPAMAAFVIVTPSPYSTIAAADGAFSLHGLPPGSYTLVVWNFDEARRRRLPVEVTGPETRVDVSQSS